LAQEIVSGALGLKVFFRRNFIFFRKWAFL